MQQIYGKEKAALTVARLKKGGDSFEVSVDSEAAIKFKKGLGDFGPVLKSEEIWADAKKGELASEKKLTAVFKTDDKIEIAKRIVKEGEIQLTVEYRAKLREEKKKKIIETIHRNAIDPRTNAPIPITRLENAFKEAKVHADDRPVDQQIQEILNKLRPVLPIRFEIKKIQVIIPAEHAAKSYHIIKSYKILKEEWQNDGSLKAVIELPLAMQSDFFDKLNSTTHGSVETKEM